MNQAQDWPKDFGIGDFAHGRHIVEKRRLNKIPCLILRNLGIPSINQNLRALLLARRDQGVNTSFALTRNDWAHLNSFVEAVAYAQVGGGVGDRVAEGLL